MTLKPIVRIPMAIVLLLGSTGCSIVGGNGGGGERAPGPGGDTIFVLRATTHILLTRRREDILPTAPLDRAAREYERLFGNMPPQILMFVDNSGRPAPMAPPTARDTVWLTAADEFMHSTSDRQARSIDEMVYVIARGWVRAAFARGAAALNSDSTSGGSRPADSIPEVPPWLDLGSATLIAYRDAEWPLLMREAENDVGILRLEELLDDSTTVSLTEEAFAAVSVQTAALLLYLQERDPDLLVALPDRLGRGERLEELLLSSSALGFPAIDSAWTAWYAKVLARAAHAATAPKR